MSTNPFDPKSPFFPWPPTVTPKPPPPPAWLDLLRPPQAASPPMPYLADLLAQIQQPKRPRIFVSYQHDPDQPYYDKFSQLFHDAYECVFDNSLDDPVDSTNTDYIMQRIRDEYITGTSCTIVLVGPTSYQRKYLDWEIKATLDKEHGLIGVRLPTAPVTPDNKVVVPRRLHANIQSGYALSLSWSQVTASADALKRFIADACSRSKTLIVNPKELKTRNG